MACNELNDEELNARLLMLKLAATVPLNWLDEGSVVVSRPLDELNSLLADEIWTVLKGTKLLVNGGLDKRLDVKRLLEEMLDANGLLVN